MIRSRTLSRVPWSRRTSYLGERLADVRLIEYHDTTVLAIRREGELIRTGLGETELQAGDLLLLWTTPVAIEYFATSQDLLIVHDDAYNRLAEAEVEELAPISAKTPIAIGILAGVVVVAAVDMLPIVIAALVGVFVMIVTGCLSPADAYDAVSWNIIFLLAGVIPLGLAMEPTGGLWFLSELLVGTAVFSRC